VQHEEEASDFVDIAVPRLTLYLEELLALIKNTFQLGNVFVEGVYNVLDER